MCGRFGFFAPPEAVAEEFDLPDLPSFNASYNIAPTEESPAVGENPGTTDRSVSSLRWGLVPSWSEGPEKFSSDLINARGETVHEKPAFRQPFRHRRCVVPASGFYEWKPTENGKQPHWIHPADRDLFGFAGLWDVWSDGDNGGTITSFTILTTEANETMKPLHDRMPVILDRDDYDTWLDPDNSDVETLRELLDPSPENAVEFYAVSAAVNNPGYDEPACVEPITVTSDK